MSMKQLGGIKVLRFGGIAAPSVDDAMSLGRCLNLCTNLETLTIVQVSMSDEACDAVLHPCRGGVGAAQPSRPRLQPDRGCWHEGLQHGPHQRRDVAKSPFSTSWTTRLAIIGNEGMNALRCSRRRLRRFALANLEELFLSDNQIGDKGMESFSTALASGPWQSSRHSLSMATLWQPCK
eukprot:7383526-Prymnesium_polylepis.2